MMRMLLLVSAMALLVHVAVVSPRRVHKSDDVQPNLNNIYDLAEKCSASQTRGLQFVENASYLTEESDECGDRFFCKVHNILHKHKDLCKREDHQMLVRTLQVYNNGRNCEKILKGMTSTGSQIEFSELLVNIKRCVQKRNFSWTKK